jgi:hypothetical protein
MGARAAGKLARTRRRRDPIVSATSSNATPEHVVEQERRALERRQPLQRQHQRQGDILGLGSASSTIGSGSHGPT